MNNYRLGWLNCKYEILKELTKEEAYEYYDNYIIARNYNCSKEVVNYIVNTYNPAQFDEEYPLTFKEALDIASKDLSLQVERRDLGTWFNYRYVGSWWSVYEGCYFTAHCLNFDPEDSEYELYKYRVVPRYVEED